jgi:hypothetical protein
VRVCICTIRKPLIVISCINCKRIVHTKISSTQPIYSRIQRRHVSAFTKPSSATHCLLTSGVLHIYASVVIHHWSKSNEWSWMALWKPKHVVSLNTWISRLCWTDLCVYNSLTIYISSTTRWITSELHRVSKMCSISADGMVCLQSMLSFGYLNIY